MTQIFAIIMIAMFLVEKLKYRVCQWWLKIIERLDRLAQSLVTRMEQGTHIEYVIFTITMKQLRPSLSTRRNPIKMEHFEFQMIFA